MKLRRIITALLLLTGSTLLFAQPDTEQKTPKALNLTDAQQEQFEKISFDMQKKQIELRAKIQTLKLEMNRLMNAEPLDRSAVEKKMNEIASQGIALRMNHLNAWAEKNKLLNADQQKIWKKMLKKRIRSMQGDGEMFRHGPMQRGMRGGTIERRQEMMLDDGQPRMERHIEKEIIKK